MFIRSELLGLGHYLPTRVLTNDDLSHMVETNDEWIRTRTGICSRHIAAENESTSVLATKAVQNASCTIRETAKKLKTSPIVSIKSPKNRSQFGFKSRSSCV